MIRNLIVSMAVLGLTTFIGCGKSETAKRNSTWLVKPKLHLFAEMAFFQSDELGDPSTFWAYNDEDFMGVVSRLAMSRGGGGQADTTPRRVVDKVRALQQG